jgi:hypothetical protein
MSRGKESKNKAIDKAKRKKSLKAKSLPGERYGPRIHRNAPQFEHFLP